MVDAGHAAHQFMDGSMGHRFVGSLAGVQMVAAVETISEGLGIGDATHGGIEVDTTVEDG